jgi:hypothetical protein
MVGNGFGMRWNWDVRGIEDIARILLEVEQIETDLYLRLIIELLSPIMSWKFRIEYSLSRGLVMRIHTLSSDSVQG